MSPRPQASPDDATAKRFLRAATQLIDAYLSDQPREQLPPRLRYIHFPAALDWLDTEDVIQLAAAHGQPGASRHAFYNRWQSRDDFLPDAVAFALLSDENFEDSLERAEQVPAIGVANSFSSDIIQIATDLLESLQRDPRSYLTLHIGPLLPQHPRLWKKLRPEMQRIIQAWAEGYTELMKAAGLVLRPEWTAHRVALALQAMLDGFVLRYRILPDDYQPATADEVGIFADSVVAFVLGVIDADRSGTSVRAALDELAGNG